MSDLKLFHLKGGEVSEIEGSAAALEKSLQGMIEANLETFLGVRFLASEFSTGPEHGGRLDTLGLDENGCPVIIEYKRATNANVINQGLFYLDWLVSSCRNDRRRSLLSPSIAGRRLRRLGFRRISRAARSRRLRHTSLRSPCLGGDFEMLVLDRMGAEARQSVEWSAPRLICIAGDFSRYDEHAIKQMNRNIELIRYRRFGDDLLLLEQVNAATAPAEATTAKPTNGTGTANATGPRYAQKTVTENLDQADKDMADLYAALHDHLTNLGDDVRVNTLQKYVAFKRIKNFACVELRPRNRCLLAFVKIDPDSLTLEDGFTRDVRTIGHFGTGDLEITIKTAEDLEKAKPLLQRSYESA